MLRLTQQRASDRDRDHWVDIDVPVEVHNVEDWKKRLVENGIAGTFRAVDEDASVHEFVVKEAVYLDVFDL